MGEVLLYDHPASPCARRVRIVLLETGLRCRSQLLDLMRMEQKAAWYLNLNPNGIVPTLVHRDRVPYESNAITEYLDQVFPWIQLPLDAARPPHLRGWLDANEGRPSFQQSLAGPTPGG